MKRLCLIGNSHLAALKLGWDRLRDAHPDVSLTFFGSHGAPACKKLRLVKGALVPEQLADETSFSWTSGGSKEIRLDDFDHFVVVALGLAPQRLMVIARTFSFVDPRLDQSKRLISRECFRQTIMDVLFARTAADVARTIRAGTTKPIWFVPQPALSTEITNTEEYREAYARANVETWALLSELWTECASSMAAEFDARLVFQPTETMRNRMFTAHELCVNSVRLTPDFATRHGSEDYTHMNSDYGMAMMKTVLGRLP